MAQSVKYLPVMQKTQEMWVWPLGQEDPLEEEMATHSSILAWKTPWAEEPVGYSPWGHRDSDTTEHVHWLSQIYLEENQFFEKLAFLRIIMMFVWILLKSNTIVTVTILQILLPNHPDWFLWKFTYL